MLRQQTQLPFLNNLVIFVTARPALKYILEQKFICNRQAFLLMHSVSCMQLHQYIYCFQNKNVHVMDHTDVYVFPPIANMELYCACYKTSTNTPIMRYKTFTNTLDRSQTILIPSSTCVLLNIHKHTRSLLSSTLCVAKRSQTH